MSQIVSWDDFRHGRYERNGEPITIVDKDGKVITTIDPKRIRSRREGKPFPFRDFVFDDGPPLCSGEAVQAVIEGRYRDLKK